MVGEAISVIRDVFLVLASSTIIMLAVIASSNILSLHVLVFLLFRFEYLNLNLRRKT